MPPAARDGVFEQLQAGLCHCEVVRDDDKPTHSSLKCGVDVFVQKQRLQQAQCHLAVFYRFGQSAKLRENRGQICVRIYFRSVMDHGR
jgi:hypothetical protein